MVGKLLIDGIDAYEEYGVIPLENSLRGVVQMHSFKTIPYTEWDEYDGAEYDLTDPKLNSKTFQIEFGTTQLCYADDLFYSLSDGAYHEFKFSELGRTYRLRMLQNDTFYVFRRLGKFVLTLADDFPEVVKELELPIQHSVNAIGYKFEGIDLSRYGIIINTAKSDASIRKLPAVRCTLTINNPLLNGLICDDQNVRFKPKDVVINCLIRTITIGDFWARWNYLFAKLSAPGEKVFEFDKLNRTYSCFYKGNSVDVFRVLPNGHIWCEFSLTLCFTGLGLRPETSYELLVTEDMPEGTFVVLEDGVTMIPIRPMSSEAQLITEDIYETFVVLEDGDTHLQIDLPIKTY